MCDFEEKIIRLLSSPHYQRLSTFKPSFSPLHVLGIPHRELSFSSVLKWLFTEPENKEFRHKFLLWIKNNLGLDGEFPIYQEIIVKREYGDSEAGRTDLFVQVPSLDLAIAIELKIKSHEGHQQIARYQNFLQNNYTNIANKIVVFITRSGRPPNGALDLPEVPVLNMSWKWIADNLNLCEGYGEMHNFRIQFAKHIRRSVLMHKEERQIVIDLLREGDNAKTIRRIINNLPDLGEKEYKDRYKSIVANVLGIDVSNMKLRKYPSKKSGKTKELKISVTEWNNANLPFTLMLYNYEKIAVRILIWSKSYERYADLLTEFAENSEGFIGEFPQIRGWPVWRSIIASDGNQSVPPETIVDYEVVHENFWKEVEVKLRVQMERLLPLIQDHLA